MNEAEESSDTVEPLFCDTSNEGGQNLVPEKCSHNLCSYCRYRRDTSIPPRDQGTFLLGPKALI